MAFNGKFILNMAHVAARNSAELEQLVALSKKPITELCNDDCIIENEDYNAVIELAVKISNDAYFGLHAGENLNLSAAGLIVQLAQTSKTVKQALELCCQFANLGCSALPMQLIKKSNLYKVVITPDEIWKKDSETSFQHTAAGVIAFTVKEFHSLTRLKHFPIEVHLPWTNLIDASEYERIFGCPVIFDSDEIAILLKKEHVEDEVISSDYNLLKVLVAHAEEKSAKLNEKKGFTSQVKQSIIKLIKPEFPSIEDVSRHLNISTRTLQRKLNEEGLTYKKLIDTLKKDFSVDYLKRPDLSIGDIAYLLNYSDTSAFTRAFKNWTGLSPVSYRGSL